MKRGGLILCIFAIALLGFSCTTEAASRNTVADNETMIDNSVASIVAMVTASATLIAVIVALRQLHLLHKSVDESEKARSASVLLNIYTIMQELRPSWQKLYGFPDDFKLWDKNQRAVADRVGVGLQQVSYLCLKELIDPSYVRDSWAGTFVKCWKKLENYIKDYRVQSGEPRELEKGGLQRRDFEVFAKKCKEVYKF